MTDKNERTRVVVTGAGAITPLGQSVESFWSNLIAGRSGVAPMTLCDPSDYPTKIAAEVKDWRPDERLDRREARRMARFSQFAVAAAMEAVTQSGLDLGQVDRTRIGVVLGNGNGGYPNVDEAVRTIVARGGMRMDPLLMPKSLPNMAAAQISLQLGLKGYNSTISTACAAATQAIGEAADFIRNGRADVVISGGTEAGISQLGLGAFAVMRAMSTRNDDPERASRPFEAKRDGFVPAEGAGVIVLESLEHAQSRNAPLLAEVAGFAACADAYHLVAPCADGEGACRAMTLAMADAGVTPNEIDYINAHGTSTPLNDLSETVAIKAAFGSQACSIPISSTKSMIGHALGGSGGLEIVACLKTLETGQIHPTVNLEIPDPDCDLDYVANVARTVAVRTLLKNSFGFGGQNACLVLRRIEPELGR
jgi:3-oxoacyl-[acyl-carrier-protein] synthase II